MVIIMFCLSFFGALAMDKQPEPESRLYALRERCVGFVARSHDSYTGELGKLPEDLLNYYNEVKMWRSKQFQNRQENEQYAHNETYYHLMGVDLAGADLESLSEDDVQQRIDKKKSQEPEPYYEGVIGDVESLEFKYFLKKLYFNVGKYLSRIPDTFEEFAIKASRKFIQNYPVPMKKCWEESDTHNRLKLVYNNLKSIGTAQEEAQKADLVLALKGSIIEAMESLNKILGYDLSISEFKEIRKSEPVLKSLLASQTDKRLSKVFMEYALLYLDVELVNVLLDNGFDPDEYICADEMTAVHEVLMIDRETIEKHPQKNQIKANQQEILKTLLERGAEADELAREDHLRWPLYRAIKLGREDLVECLVTYGDDIDLTRGIWQGEENYLHLVLHTNQDPDRYAKVLPIKELVQQQNSDDETVLFDAVRYGRFSSIKKLVESYGADVTVRNSDGQTCSQLAQAVSGNEPAWQEIAHYLVSKENEQRELQKPKTKKRKTKK